MELIKLDHAEAGGDLAGDFLGVRVFPPITLGFALALVLALAWVVGLFAFNDFVLGRLGLFIGTSLFVCTDYSSIRALFPTVSAVKNVHRPKHSWFEAGGD
jgi:hypothetical protein